MGRAVIVGRQRRSRDWAQPGFDAAGNALEAWPWTIVPFLIALAGAIAYLIIQPDSTDLAAHTFRTELFEREGFVIFNGQWYGGHHALSYSLLFPPIASVIGVRVTGAIAAVAVAVLFSALGHRAWGGRAWPAAWWMAAGSVTLLLTGRLTFALGVAIGLAALLAAQRRHPIVAVVLAILCPLASPVAGLFLALAGLAWAIGGPSLTGGLVALASFGVAAVMAAMFPEGGTQPFGVSSFWAVLVYVIGALILLPRNARTLQIGIALYGVATLAALLIDTPMGTNAVRLGSLFGGPVLAGAILAAPATTWWREAPIRPRRAPITSPLQPVRGRQLGGPRPSRRDGDPLYRAGKNRDWRVLALLIALVPLIWWQWQPAVRDVRKAANDPAIDAAYYQPLIDFLRTQRSSPFRVEIPFTLNHWEAAHVAPEFPLARGWQRQLDVKYHQLFYDDDLTPEEYREWLDEHAVRFVALPDAKLDFTAEREAELIRAGLPYLRPVWSNEHWQVYAVRDWSRMADGPAVVTRYGVDQIDLRASEPGDVFLRVRYSPYWALVEGSGCVERAPGGWTLVKVRRRGNLRLAMDFKVDRIGSTEPRCT
jgi:hypothetical protein